MENEIWKDIKDYEGLYEISNFGRVRSKERYTNPGHGYRKLPSRILGQHEAHNYLYVCLCKNNKPIHKKVHRLVYETFIGMIPPDKTIDHINGNRYDNSYLNLHVLTIRENVCKYMSTIKKQSRYLGVTRHEPTNKWRSKIFINHKQVHLGLFLAESEAGLAYQKAKIKFGLF